MIFTGKITFQERGCEEGGGQDYARLNGADGIIEFHPAWNTSAAIMPLDQALTVTVDTGNIGTGFDFTFSNLTISKVNLGITYDDVVSSAGANAVVFHVPHGTVPAGWIVGAKLNCGLTRN